MTTKHYVKAMDYLNQICDILCRLEIDKVEVSRGMVLAVFRVLYFLLERYAIEHEPNWKSNDLTYT